MLGKKLNAIRCDDKHVHTGVINRPKGTASSLGNWTTDLAKTIMDGIEDRRYLEKQHGGYARYAKNFDDIEEEIEANPAEAEAPMHASAATIFSKHGDNIEMAEWTAVPPLMRAAIKKIHESHSH